MALNFRLSDTTMSGEEFDALARSFSVEAASEGLAIRRSDEPGPAAGPGQRGDPFTIGAFVMALVSSGAVVALFNILKSYVERSEELTIEFTKKGGTPFKLQMKNVTLEKFQAVVKELEKNDA
jgi:Effector Associated Constant Component 1